MSGDSAVGKPVFEEDVTPSTSAPASAQNPITTSPPKPLAGSSSPSKSVEPPHPLQPTPSHSHSGVIDLTSPQSSPSKRQSATPSLTSSRPAPASPASSRPPSTQFDSSLRDRSGSLSASSNRRVSSSSASSSTAKGPKSNSRSRASSKVRPKSMLGTNITLPESSTTTPLSEDQKDSSTLPIPEHNEQDPSASTSVSASQMMESSWGDDTPTESFQVILPSVIIRDFAYPSTDERYHGRGVIEDEGNASESNSNVFKWPWKGDPAESSSGGAGGGWGGFGFLGGWRNRSAQDTDDRPTFEDDDDEDDISDDEDQGDDQYYSSPAQSDSGFGPSASTSSYSYNILEPLSPSIEPKGYYRAAYPFQALSSSEMNLQEGDLVNLVGRGNGDPGWVIARRVNIQNGKIIGTDEKVGLVPESYLERVEVVEE